jgi:hypothetical protein
MLLAVLGYGGQPMLISSTTPNTLSNPMHISTMIATTPERPRQTVT